MILPKQLLEETKYYTEVEKSVLFRMCTIFTLYPKKWWGRKKVIKMEWSMVDQENYVSTFQRTRNIVQLSEQLEEHFRV